MAGWIDDFTSVMNATAGVANSATGVLQGVQNVLNPTQVNKPPTVTGTDPSPKQALVDTKTKLPGGNQGVLIAVAVVVGILLLSEW